MVKYQTVLVALIVIAGGVFMLQAKADNVLSQPDFSSSQFQYWGSYGAAIGIASGTITEFTTTTAALGSFSFIYLGWECTMTVQDNGIPSWCNRYIPLTIATTTILGTSTKAYVIQNPHQPVDGNVQLYYVAYYGYDGYLGSGVATNTTPNLSWAWSCGDSCKNGGNLGGTSHLFVPYIEMGPQADPPKIAALIQSAPVGGIIPEGGTVFGNSISLSAFLRSPAQDPLFLEVEVEPLGRSFSGIPTASSTRTASGATASVVVPGLSSGGYRWAARAVDAITSESSPWTYFMPGGAVADFAIQAPKEPVVFVPGIVGSRLTRAADGKEIWPDLGDMVISPSDDYLDDLALAPDGSQIAGREMAAGSIVDREDVLGMTIPFYDDTLRAFENNGYALGTTLFAFPYDWRLGVRNAAASLANVISAARAASFDGKISIVGYSMGGLVAKEYLAGLADTSFVDKLILAGVPQLGSPAAFKALNYGDNLGFQVPVLNFDILNHNEVKKIAQNMQSIYDLLPSRAYLADAGGYVQDFRNGASTVLDYEGTSRFMTAVPTDSRNGPMLGAADALHADLDGKSVRAPDVYNISGCSEPTISEYRIYDNGAVDITRSAGDGTVPLVSAMDRADGFRNYFISGKNTGINHANLVRDPRTLSLITAILDEASASFPLPDGFSASLASCFQSSGSASSGTTVEFSAHGAASLVIRNDAGLSTGSDASGTVNLGIPYSSYEAIGDNYFITVPASETYHIIAESASSSDALVVKAKSYDGASAATSATYVVPALNPTQENNEGTTTASIDFSSADSFASATVTAGEGAAPVSLRPAIEQASSSSDVMPPDVVVSGVPASAEGGSTTTISFSASDRESGIALVGATFNGAIVASGDTITFTHEGDNILRIEAVDNAGNPIVKEMNVPVSAPEPPHETVLSAIADTYIDSGNPEGNNGNASILRLRARGKDRALVKFDESAIESAIGSSTAFSATLDFTVAKNWMNRAAPETIGLYRMAVPWDGAAATTWSTENASGTVWAADPSATSTVSNNTTNTVSFDVTADIAAFMNGTENEGWIMRKTNECAPGAIDFGSRESGMPPKLMIRVPR